jgi:hypothetical protein
MSSRTLQSIKIEGTDDCLLICWKNVIQDQFVKLPHTEKPVEKEKNFQKFMNNNLIDNEH